MKPLSVLFLCTGNSCRSIMAEALLAHFGQGRVAAHSAGSHPTGSVHRQSLATLRARAIPTRGLHSKSWDELADTRLDVILTVCDAAAGETCPLFTGAPVRAHWGVRDPDKFRGTETEIAAEFDAVCDILQSRIHALLALPLETMNQTDLQKHLETIGRT